MTPATPGYLREERLRVIHIKLGKLLSIATLSYLTFCNLYHQLVICQEIMYNESEQLIRV